MLRYNNGKASLVVLLLIIGLLAFTGCNFAGGGGANSANSSAHSSTSDKDKKEAKLLKDKEAGLFVLVNKLNSVPEHYEPNDLTQMTYCAQDRDPSTRFMRKEAVTQFDKMVEEAAANNIDIVMTTAYRSYGFQNVLWTHNVLAKGSEEEANKTSARPVESEHRTGLAVDISTKAVNYKVTTDFANTDAGKWVGEHAHEYGFIIRYPEDKSDETGYSYEAWHLRYVGKTAAEDIYEKGLSLEKYLEKNGLATTLNGKPAVFEIKENTEADEAASDAEAAKADASVEKTAEKAAKQN